MPFIAPAVPTGMKAGVRTTPCGVVSLPVRGGPVGARQVRNDWQDDREGSWLSLSRNPTAQFNPLSTLPAAPKAVDEVQNLPHKSTP